MFPACCTPSIFGYIGEQPCLFDGQAFALEPRFDQTSFVQSLIVLKSKFAFDLVVVEWVSE